METHFISQILNQAALKKCYKLVGWFECLPEACKSAWQVKSAQVRGLKHIVVNFTQRLSATGVLTVL